MPSWYRCVSCKQHIDEFDARYDSHSLTCKSCQRKRRLLMVAVAAPSLLLFGNYYVTKLHVGVDSEVGKRIERGVSVKSSANSQHKSVSVPVKEVCSTLEDCNDERLIVDTEIHQQLDVVTRLLKARQFKKASDTLHLLEIKHPDRAIIYQYRSNIEFLTGNLEGAKAALELSLELEPESQVLKLSLNTVNEMMGDSRDRE